MPLKPLYSIVLSVALLCLSGCATLRPAPEKLPPLMDPAGYAQAALAVPAQTSQSGVARITIKVKNTSRSYKAVYAGRYPDGLRLEVLGLFNQPGLYVSANRETGLTLYVPSKNAWYRGPATAGSMRRISGIMMDPFDIVSTLHNSPPGPDPDQAPASCDQEGGSYTCRLEHGKTVQDIWIDPASGSIIRSRLFENGTAVHDISYRDFVPHGERPIAEKITMLFNRYATSLEIELRDPLTTPLANEQLNLQAPDGTVFLPLSSFFEGQ